MLAGGLIILVLDDMQWVDSTTREFLFFLLQSLKGGPLLVICVGRTPNESWCPNTPHVLVRLEPFSDDQADRIFHSVLGTNLLDPKISDNILSQAGGNPLFLVEMAETLKRQELLVCDSRACTLSLEVEDLEIPGSIQGVLAARLDALPEECKRVVQLASIIGKEFSFAVLKHLVDGSESLHQILVYLERDRLVEKVSSGLGGQYVFRHHMMREIAYQSLLRQNRRHYHRLVGERRRGGD